MSVLAHEPRSRAEHTTPWHPRPRAALRNLQCRCRSGSVIGEQVHGSTAEIPRTADVPPGCFTDRMGSTTTVHLRRIQALATPVDDTLESSALVPCNGFHLEPRCRVCRNDQVRKKVNDMLATGASYAMVLRALAADNADLDKCDRVTVDSIRNHCGRHFPVQSFARATYREILERRAKANSVDFVDGVATAITPSRFTRRSW